MIDNEYELAMPSDQNALDLFRGSWISTMPDERPELQAGLVPAFEDKRIAWAESEIGGFDGLRVLELGPFEGGHSYMLEQRGASSVLAIESNRSSFLKCLVVKEVLNLKRVRFLLGDFVQYLRETQERFDVCIASGVLYHMTNPAELIHLIAETSDIALLWTHYYDEDIVEKNPELNGRFSGRMIETHKGTEYTFHRHHYQQERALPCFCGGPAMHSHWMERADILRCLRAAGFSDLTVGQEQTVHPHGPSFCVLARREARPAVESGRLGRGAVADGDDRTGGSRAGKERALR